MPESARKTSPYCNYELLVDDNNDGEADCTTSDGRCTADPKVYRKYYCYNNDGEGAVSLGVAGGLAVEEREAYLSNPTYVSNVKQAYSEREVSSIYFSRLETGQDLCGEGDIAGQ